MIETEAVNAGIGIYSFFSARLATGLAPLKASLE